MDQPDLRVGDAERDAARLIWRVVCQPGRPGLARWRWVAVGVVGWVGGGPAVLCATRGQTDIRGFGGRRTMVRRGEPLSRVGRGQPPEGRVAHSRVAGSPRVAGPPPTQPTGFGGVGAVGLLGAGDGPAE